MKLRVVIAVLLLSFLANAQRPIDNPTDRRLVNIGLPIYKGAIPKPEGPGVPPPDRATLSFSDLRVQEATAEKFVSADSSTAVLEFYRAQLQRFGSVTECTGGKNLKVSVSLDDRSVANLGACREEEFGEGETELKAGRAEEFFVVTVRPVGTHTEFALVRVCKAHRAATI